MADYERMYKALFDDVTKVIELLQEAQCKCEELYIDTTSKAE